MERICRVCLTKCNKDVKSRSIFSELYESEILDENLFFVYEILCMITTIRVSKGDGFPALICGDCMNQANAAYKFKHQCEKSQTVLENCITGKLKDENLGNIKSEESSEEVDDTGIEDKEMSESNDKSNFDYEDAIKLEPCITTDIFNLHEVEAENVNIEAIFDSINAKSKDTSRKKPKMKNISTVDANNCARKCTECGNIYKTAYAYRNHMCNRKVDRKLCPHCGKSISKSHYKAHLYMHTGRRDYVCKICDKAYSAKCSLKFHMATHTGDKPYLCTICGKRFIQPTALKYHMRFHNNDRRYKCTICDKSFFMQCHLVAHVRSHSGVKPFTCETCGKGFSRKLELRMHAFLHTGEKPFKCGFCEKRFARKTHLTLHEMTHNGRRPHVCKICGKGFIQNQPLKCHMRTHHEQPE